MLMLAFNRVLKILPYLLAVLCRPKKTGINPFPSRTLTLLNDFVLVVLVYALTWTIIPQLKG